MEDSTGGRGEGGEERRWDSLHTEEDGETEASVEHKRKAGDEAMVMTFTLTFTHRATAQVHTTPVDPPNSTTHIAAGGGTNEALGNQDIGK